MSKTLTPITPAEFFAGAAVSDDFAAFADSPEDFARQCVQVAKLENRALDYDATLDYLKRAIG